MERSDCLSSPTFTRINTASKQRGAIIISLKVSEHSEIAGIQYVRGIAACLVVLTHASGILGLPTMFGTTSFNGVLYNGAVGVDLFFVVSGFIITVVSLHKGTLAPRLNLFHYAGKRVARILPFLWVCVIVYALFRFAGTGKYDVVPYLNAMFLWPLGEVRPPVVWTLRQEALFYIVFALSYLGGKRRPYLLLLWCLSPVMYGFFHEDSGAEQGVLQELGQFVFNPSNLTFGCGVLLGLAYQTTSVFKNKHRFSPHACGLLMLVGSAVLFFSFNGFGSARVNLLASLVVFASLWIPVSSGKIARLGHVLGDASYSIYLTHNLVFLVGGAAWMAVLGPRFYYAALFLLPLIAVFCGVLVYYWVERPIVRIAQGVVQGIRHRIERPAEVVGIQEPKRD
jgi:exopolysaccharide production protein ExoZ